MDSPVSGLLEGSDIPNVARITIGRLHNLGDYEHVRIEVAVDVPRGADPTPVLTELVEVLDDLKPVKADWSERRAVALVTKADAGEDLDEFDVQNLRVARERVADLDERRARYQAAADRLRSLGGSAVHRDAKEEWDDDRGGS